MLQGQLLHPYQHTVQLFTEASNEDLGNCTAKGLWSKPESHLHINFLELKAAPLALKRFEQLFGPDHFGGNRQHHSCVLHKNGGGMISGSFCAFLWRLLSWCNLKQLSYERDTFQAA